MSTFKVGQRVRVIACDPGLEFWLGFETTIKGLPGAISSRPNDYELSSGPPQDRAKSWSANARDLVPLTDLPAEQFIERIKKLEREPALIREKA
jgi:hypothetical protein